MNLLQLESLLSELMQAAQEILSSGEQLDDAFINELADEIEATQAHIAQMRSQQTPEEHIDEITAQNPQTTQPQPEIPPMESSMPSSNVNSFAYNPDNGELFVKFQGDYPSENGPVYKYGGVPEQIFDLFRQGAIPAKTNGSNDWGEWWEGKSPSLGSSLNVLLKESEYPYQRLT